MVDVDELKQNEVNELTNVDTDFDDEIYDLESLILDGTDTRVPVIITYPKEDGTLVKASAKIRPVTNAEWNYAIKAGMKNDKFSSELEVVTNCLYTKDEKPFPRKLISSLPSGVVTELANEIVRISGINVKQEDGLKMAKELMGF